MAGPRFPVLSVLLLLATTAKSLASSNRASAQGLSLSSEDDGLRVESWEPPARRWGGFETFNFLAPCYCYKNNIDLDSPVLYLPLTDDSYADGAVAQQLESTVNANGTYHGAIGVTTNDHFPCNAASRSPLFNTSSGYVDLPGSVVGQTNPANGIFSVEVWVRSLGVGMTVVTSRNDAAKQGYSVLVSGSGTWQFYTGNGVDNDITESTVVANNTWQHVVCTRDGSGDARIYVDGVLVAGPKSSGFVQNTNPGWKFFVGQFHDGGLPMQGNIASVAVYYTALSAARILDHYNHGMNTTCETPAPTAAPTPAPTPAPPEAYVTRVVSDNGVSTSLATVANTVTLYINATEALNPPSVTMAGRDVNDVGTVTTSDGGLMWACAFVINGTEPQVAVAWSIMYQSNVTGRDGATNLTGTTAQDGTSVVIDYTPPTISATRIYSSNANTAFAAAADFVVLDFYTNEAASSTPLVTMGTVSAALSSSADSQNFTFNASVSGGMPQGAVAFDLFVTDGAGNNASLTGTDASGTSVTVDTIAPVAGTVTLVSSHTGFPRKATVGDVLTLTFQVTDTNGVGTPATTNVLLAGATVDSITKTGSSPDTFVANYTVPSTPPQGVVAIDVFGVIDPAGNVLANITAVTDGNTVEIDSVGAVIVGLKIFSDNTNPLYATTGNQITLEMLFSVPVNQPTIQFLGVAADTVTQIGGSGSLSTNWTAVVAASSLADLSTVTVAVSGFTDELGNAPAAINNTVTDGSVYVDRTAPSFSSTSLASNNAIPTLAKENDEITLTFTATEELQANPTVNIGGASATVAKESGNTYTAKVTVTAGMTNTSFVISQYSDLAGNAGVDFSTLTGQDVTIDTTAPTLSPVTIASNNQYNTARAKVGDNVTVSFTSDESISTPSVTIASGACTSFIQSSSSTVWSASCILSASVDTGAISFSISFSDLAGNPGTAVTTTTDGSSVTFDKTAPTLSNTLISSNNPNPLYAIQGNTVTVNFTSDEGIQTPTVTIGGTTAAVIEVSLGTGVMWSASRVMQGASDTAPDGTISLNIAFRDQAGNDGVAQTAIQQGNNVIYDKTPPTLPYVHIETALSATHIGTGQRPVIIFNASDTILTPTVSLNSVSVTPTLVAGLQWSATGDPVASPQSGNMAFSVDFTAVSGLAGTTVTSTTDGSNLVIDTVNPQYQSITMSSNNPVSPTARAHTGDTLMVTVTADEDLKQQPIVYLAGRLASVQTSNARTYVASVVVASDMAEGPVAFNVTGLVDLAGNVGPTATQLTAGNVTVIDNTPPTVLTATIYSSNVPNTVAKLGHTITLNFSVSEPLWKDPAVTIGGGIAAVSQVGPLDYTAALVLSSETDAAIRIFNYVDLANNSGVVATSTTDGSSVTVDNVKPTLAFVSIQSDNALLTTHAIAGDNVTLTFRGSEHLVNVVVTIGGLTAVVQDTNSSNPGVQWSAVVRLDPALTLPADGVLAISIAFDDLAGNKGNDVTVTTDSSSVLFDKFAPTLPIVNVTGSNGRAFIRYGDYVILAFTSSDPIQRPTVVINSIVLPAANITGDSHGVAWVAIGAPVLVSDSGAVSFSVSFSSVAGLAGTTVSATTDSSTVVVDNTAPTLTAVTTSSSNAFTPATRARAGDTVTLTITTSEVLLAPPIAYLQHTTIVLSVMPVASHEVYTGSVVITGAMSGPVSFNITAVVDRAGNVGPALTTQITSGSAIIVDNTAPSITASSIASNVQGYNQYAKSGDTVTLTTNFSEALYAAPWVTVGGTNATTALVVAGSQPQYSSSLVLAAQTSATPNVVMYRDLAGNLGVAATTTTDGSSVTVDNVSPQISNISATSSNSLSTHAIINDTVTVVFRGSEALRPPTVTIGASATEITAGFPQPMWYTATRKLTGEEPDGVLEVVISVADLAGNTASVTQGSGITFDNSLPFLTHVSLTGHAGTALVRAGQVAELHFVASDPIKTPTVTMAGVQVSSSNITNVGLNYTVVGPTILGSTANGALAFTVDFESVAGLRGKQRTTTTDGSSVTVDTVPPSVSSASIASANSNTVYAKLGDVVTITVVFSEAVQTPTVTANGVALPNSNISVTSMSPYTVAAVLDVDGAVAEGVINVGVQYLDLAGNAGTALSNSGITGTVTVDKTAPTLSDVQLSSSTTVNTAAYAKAGDQLILVFKASEALPQAPVVQFSSVSASSVTMTNSTTREWTATLTVASGSPADGAVTVSVSFVDLAGNTASENSASGSVTVDTTAPTITAATLSSTNSYAQGARNGDTLSLVFTVSETCTVSAVTFSTVAAASVVANGTNTFRAELVVTVSAPADGAVTLAVTYKDTAGNTGVALSGAVTTGSVAVDNTPPSPSLAKIFSNNLFSPLSRSKSGDTVTVNFTAAEVVTVSSASINSVTATLALVGSCQGPSPCAAYRAIVGGDGDGVVSFAIGVTDLVGNTATFTATTDSSSVTNDNVAPSTTNTLTSTGVAAIGGGQLARAGQQLSLAISATEAVFLPGVTFSGVAGTVTGSGSSYTATLTVAQGSPTDGTVNINVGLTDLAGNTATSQSATGSVVVDTTAPLLSSVSITSSLTPTTATTRSTITVTVVADSRLSSLAVTVAGFATTTSMTSADGRSWTATRVMSGQEPAGLVSLSVQFVDEAGNNGVAVTNTTDGTFVMFNPDNVAPTIQSVSVATNNTYGSSLATGGNIVTVSFLANEVLHATVTPFTPTNPSFPLSLLSSTVTDSSSNKLYTYVFVVPYTVSADSVRFNITFTDIALNHGTNSPFVTAGSIVIDNVAPTLTVTATSSNSFNSNYATIGDVVTVTVSSTEALASVGTVTAAGATLSLTAGQSFTYQGTLTVGASSTQGAFVVTLTGYRDAVGLGPTVSLTTGITVDSVLPTATSVSLTSSGTNAKWAKTGDSARLTVHASEALTLASSSFGSAQVAGAMTTAGTQVYVISALLPAATADGVLAFNVVLRDVAGNSLTLTTTTDGTSITFDKTPPTLTLVTFFSPSGAGNRVAAGGQAQVSVVSSEIIQNPVFTITSVQATAQGGNRSWFAVHTVGAAFVVGQTLTFSVSNFVDRAGNVGQSVQSSTDRSAVTFETVSGASENTNVGVDLTFTLDITFPTTPAEEEQLYTDVENNVHTSLPPSKIVPLSRIEAFGATQGSVNVQVRILPPQGAITSSTVSSAAVAAEIREQAVTPNSPLLAGTVTRFLAPALINSTVLSFDTCPDGSQKPAGTCPDDPAASILTTQNLAAVGVVVVLALVIAVICCCRRRKKKSQAEEAANEMQMTYQNWREKELSASNLHTSDGSNGVPPPLPDLTLENDNDIDYIDYNMAGTTLTQAATEQAEIDYAAAGGQLNALHHQLSADSNASTGDDFARVVAKARKKQGVAPSSSVADVSSELEAEPSPGPGTLAPTSSMAEITSETAVTISGVDDAGDDAAPNSPLMPRVDPAIHQRLSVSANENDLAGGSPPDIGGVPLPAPPPVDDDDDDDDDNDDSDVGDNAA